MTAAVPVSIAGSTGSIGQSTLDVIRRNRERFTIRALGAQRNLDLLQAQVEEFSPAFVSLPGPEHARAFRARIGSLTDVVDGEDGFLELARGGRGSILVNSVVGFKGLQLVLEAARAGSSIALANKESLVAGGPLVEQALPRTDYGFRSLVPIDSEHSSILQCLQGLDSRASLRKIYITASGGPFWKMDRAALQSVSVEQAINHPRWSMGKKISVDSATMMNKGLEVIEAANLFNLPAAQISVLVHPQSIVHGLISLDDGAVLAALAVADMRLPISFALGSLAESDCGGIRAERVFDNGVAELDLLDVGRLDFQAPDDERFPLLRLAYHSLESGGSNPAILNAANEVAVAAFLERRIPFTAIAELVGEVCQRRSAEKLIDFGQLVEIDADARALASKLISSRSN